MINNNAKIRKTFNYLIRAVIVVVTYGFIYRQVFVNRKLDEIAGIFQPMLQQRHTWVILGVVLILMLVNWGAESAKWRLLIAKIEKLSFLRAFEAVLTGVSVSIFTPNRTGDYLGRVFILEKGNHIEGILITIIGSFAQIVVTLSIGLFGFLAFMEQYLQLSYAMHEYVVTAMIFLVPVCVFILLLLFFRIGLLSDLIQKYLPARWEKFYNYACVFGFYSSHELFRVLLFSLFRYAIFTVQFYILLRLFGVVLPFSQGLILIAVIYLAMSLVPSVALVDLGVRGSVSVFVIGLYFSRYGGGPADLPVAVLVASTFLWFINLILPALMGTFFVFKLRFFRK
ncbi:MAG: flippase-like domain-containing protein [Bacteroidales bacterium]|nr:flippase-like domain-containing protein [Bacteroidales bacterium]